MLRKRLLPALLLAALLTILPTLTACAETPAIGDINDSATIILMRYEDQGDGISGVVYRQVTNFDALMGQSDLPLLVVFYSATASVNSLIIPRLEQMADDYSEQLQIVWVDADAEEGVADSFNVQELPQFSVVVAGSLKRSLVGYGDQGAVMLDELLAPYLTTP